MKHMRSIINAALAAAVAGTLAFGAVASAQDQGGQGEHRGNGCMREAMAKLNPPLSDEQKAKLKELRESGQKGPEAREARDKILSPEQVAELRDARKACEAQGGGQG
jgi:Spy/CpxP family protein refolding chaperone